MSVKLFLPTFLENAEVALKALLNMYYYVLFASPFRLEWNEVTCQYYLKRSIFRQVKNVQKI